MTTSGLLRTPAHGGLPTMSERGSATLPYSCPDCGMRMVYPGRCRLCLPAYASTLARFRADPSKVRIAVRRMPDGVWRVVVSSGGHRVSGYHRIPLRALVLAWRGAVDQGLPGMDPGMGWAYDHPQRAHR